MSNLHDAIGAYVASIPNPKTAKSYSRALVGFEKIAPAELDRVNETYLMPYADTMTGKAIASKQIYFSAVISFFAFLIYTRQSEAVNLDRARMIKHKLIGRTSRISNYNTQELQALVDYAKGLDGRARGTCGMENLRDRALILTLAETGLRRSEAVSLKLADVDLEQGQAVVIGKGDKQAVVYFGPDSLQAVKDYIEARADKSPSSPLFMREGRGGLVSDINHLNSSSVNKLVNRRAREVLGHGIAVHALRHHFVTSVWRETHDLMLAKELARHASVLTTQRYTHVSDEQLRAAHRRVFA